MELRHRGGRTGQLCLLAWAEVDLVIQIPNPSPRCNQMQSFTVLSENIWLDQARYETLVKRYTDVNLLEKRICGVELHHSCFNNHALHAERMKPYDSNFLWLV